ncbi:hypothetical protein [Candidatus Chrysopegis kryptomonas]|uniref:Uncharacterized protein n=1 Tax=Candidatus Chryseopegocella kryptomonas TaxID=1633643 RepID=A0A0P1NVZ1_9BACT|nr:hypothetical protein [Candidatus Chrysopegis kryptomonas]CUT03471.1 hypothetical protein JGI23_01483 [Candidatus Chrysopegis kryptomonas]
MKYREEIITITVAEVSPRGLRASDGRFFNFPRPVPFISEIIPAGSVVSFVWVRTPHSVIYKTAGDPTVCKFYIKQILTIN